MYDDHSDSSSSGNVDEHGVETVLAEREFPEFGTKYLVKWVGEPIQKCTWEPKQSLHDGHTADWEQKKLDISQGKSKSFDVPNWEREVSLITTNKSEKRRGRNERKRQKKKRMAGFGPSWIGSTNKEADKEQMATHVNPAQTSGPTQAPVGPQAAPVYPETTASFDIDQIFSDQFWINYEQLAAVKNGLPHSTRSFYVMIPPEVGPEAVVLMEFLKKHGGIIFSNRVKGDWERFVHLDRQGIVLIHAEFVDFYKLDGLASILQKSFSFWGLWAKPSTTTSLVLTSIPYFPMA